MCEGASKQTPDLKILPRRDRAPPFWNSWIRHWLWSIFKYFHLYTCNSKLHDIIIVINDVLELWIYTVISQTHRMIEKCNFSENKKNTLKCLDPFIYVVVFSFMKKQMRHHFINQAVIYISSIYFMYITIYTFYNKIPRCECKKSIWLESQYMWHFHSSKCGRCKLIWFFFFKNPGGGVKILLTLFLDSLLLTTDLKVFH